MKKFIKLGLGLSLVAALAVGATLALLKDQTATVTNTFSSSGNVSIELREPQWDGYEFGQAYPSTPGSSKDPADSSKTLGIDVASNYIPGSVIEKNPTIKNVGTSQPAYVAIKVVYQDGNGTGMKKAAFEAKYGKIDLSNEFDIIEETDTYTLYMYNKTLAISLETPALFTKVTINDDIELEGDLLPSFAIKATGYAVQSEKVTQAQAITEIKALAK